MNKDVIYLRQLAEQYQEIANKNCQSQKRDMWRKHHNLENTQIPILVNIGRWDSFNTEICSPDKLVCDDPFYRYYEFELKHGIFMDYIGSDNIVEPFITVPAIYNIKDWGLKIEHLDSPISGGAYHFSPVLKGYEDFNKLKIPAHDLNRPQMIENAERISNAIGDFVEINIEKAPYFRAFEGDISNILVQMTGLEELMTLVYDEPEFLHSVLAFMRDGILKVHQEAEQNGDWSCESGHNQAEKYSAILPDPKPNKPVNQKDIWGFFESQEYTMISPAMFDEFLLQYQLPIMERFGLVAYGCCEDLTNKIDYLRKIPNLRRIAVSPWANVAKCAEQIGKDYVLSWRPNPAPMVCTGFDESYIKKEIKEGLAKTQGCIFDITLKDVLTVQNEPDRLKKWVEIVRDICENDK